jgi:hypothetical protein
VWPSRHNHRKTFSKNRAWCFVLRAWYLRLDDEALSSKNLSSIFQSFSVAGAWRRRASVARTAYGPKSALRNLLEFEIADFKFQIQKKSNSDEGKLNVPVLKFSRILNSKSAIQNSNSRSVAASKFYGQAKGLISTGQLSTLLHLHLQPINLVVYQESHGQD